MVEKAMTITDEYSKSTVEFKRQYIHVLFPQKIVYENGTYRTPKTNSEATLMSLVNSELRKNKKGTELDFTSLSHHVIPLGCELHSIFSD